MGQKILIVEDSSSIRLVVSNLLQEQGYEVTQAVDGRDGLKQLNGQQYHLIISDYNMPHLNGLDFVAAGRQIPAYKFTPIIMLTTENDDEKKQRAKTFGVKIWMHKPFDAQALINAVKKIILR
jgi:two-component system chemotaxis response regulator CheY